MNVFFFHIYLTTLSPPIAMYTVIFNGGGSGCGTIDIWPASTVEISSGTTDYSCNTINVAGLLSFTGGETTVGGIIDIIGKGQVVVSNVAEVILLPSLVMVNPYESIQIEGGTVSTDGRSSASNPVRLVSYVQTGGQLNIDGYLEVSSMCTMLSGVIYVDGFLSCKYLVSTGTSLLLPPSSFGCFTWCCFLLISVQD